VSVIIVLAGEIELYFDDDRELPPEERDPLVLPKGYGVCVDDSGEFLEECSLFLGPIEVTRERIDEVPDDARYWFGSDYEVRRAFVDVPSGKWKPVGQVAEILYYRPGEHDGDWKHEFYRPVPLFQNRDWYKLKLPRDCKITHRGIERP
jgi:hypothetical protein